MIKWFIVAVSCAAVFSGCGPRTEVAPASGLYGPPVGDASGRIERALPDRSAGQPWLKGDFSVIQTELSPASLYHSRSRSLSFFTHLAGSGLGAPSHIAMPTQVGPKIFPNGGRIDATRLNECWLVAWFAGAAGWTNWDVPWLIVLQHKPMRIQLGSNGLSFTFEGEAGYAALMPLYGHYKPASFEARSNAVFQAREPKKRVKTWDWYKALPADPLARARYWASALHEFPVYGEDSFSVDRARDSVVLRQSFRFLSWDDDWRTKHWKLAPVSPVLGLAVNGGFPAEFSKKPFDMEIVTPDGPLLGVEEVDSYEVTLPVLRYVNETAAVGAPDTNAHPGVAVALEKLRATLAARLHPAAAREPGDEWLARALPYLEEPARTAAVAELKRRMRAVPSDNLEALWSHAHFTGDWELVRERWPSIKKLFNAPAEARWAGFGRGVAPELGREAGACLAYARLAYKTGDMDGYNHGCQMFARALTQHWARQRGAAYFRLHQPGHSMEAMDEEVFLTSLRGNGEGWRMDGPNYPAVEGEREFKRRWQGFRNEDVARFQRENFLPETRRELDALRSPRPDARLRAGASDPIPSLAHLRSLLLNEPPAQATNPAAQFAGAPGEVITSCLDVLRASRPARFERLIPGGPASAFVPGLEREVPGSNPHLVQDIRTQVHSSQTGAAAPAWPRVTWRGWATSAGTGWNFGQVTAGTNPPSGAESLELNWNTRVTVLSP